MKNNQIIYYTILFVLCAGLFPFTNHAQQSESPVACVEGAEPVLLNYGDYTTDCEINTVTDLDSFSFNGSDGDDIRITVRSFTAMDPRVELRDPVGNVIEDNWCNGVCSFSTDASLEVSGTYTIAVSDQFSDQTGGYTLQLERFPPITDSPEILYNTAVTDEVSQVTDLDFFVFQGSQDTDIRVTVRSFTTMDPRIELRDPNGEVIEDIWCNGACSLSVSPSLAVTGTYLIAISDQGSDHTGAYEVNLQCLFGDCPDSSVQPLECEIVLNQTNYFDGDTVTAEVLRWANPGSVAVPVEWKIWLGFPSLATISALDTAAGGPIFLPGGFEQDFGPVSLFEVTSDLPRGDYSLGCRILDPVTGRTKTFTRTPFTIEEQTE